MELQQQRQSREQILSAFRDRISDKQSEQSNDTFELKGWGDSELIDVCCDLYEFEFRKGNHLDIESLLGRLPISIRPKLLVELLMLNKELAGNSTTVENPTRLIRKFPYFETEIREAIEPSAKPIADPDSGKKRLSHPKPLTKRLVGNYQQLRVIGEGGMGTVWLAEQSEPVQRRVALKIVKAGLDSAQVISRFEAERQALTVMEHPGIARIIDAGSTDEGSPFFAMELVNGIPITEYCDKKRLDLRQRMKLFIQICEAVQHAHQKGIIHRDLKPGNILVSEEAGQPKAKIIDFGLAKALDVGHKLTDRSRFTEFGQVLGTLKYMSPEQAGMDSLDVDTRSDIYSLGVILYELLVDKNPLDDEAFAELGFLKILEWIREKECPRPSQRLSVVSENVLASIAEKRRTNPKILIKILKGDLDWIVMRSLDKERDRRYESANGLAEDIRRFLVNDPVSARPPSASYQFSKFIRKNRGLVITTSLLMLAILLGMAGTLGFAVLANGAKNEAIERQHFAEATLERERTVLLESVKLSEQLADLYLNAGERELALPLFEKALERSQNILGLHNETTLAQMNSVAFLYGLNGRLHDALVLMEKLKEASVQVNGPNHEKTLSAKNNLGAMYLRFDRVEDAIPLFEQVHEQRKKVLGQNDFDLRVSYRWLIIVYSMTENWRKARPIVEDWLAQLVRVGEKNSPEYAWAMTTLAEIEYGLSNYEGALTAAKAVSKLPSPQPVDIARAANIVAACKFHLETTGLINRQSSLNQLESSYLELKNRLDSLPGFKQYFVVNAIKRNRDIFDFLQIKKASRLWERELQEVQDYLKGSPAPLHPGIPHFDPLTGKETPRFEKIKK